MAKILELIVCGAAGRMGQELVSLIQGEPSCVLAGAVDRAERLKDLSGLQCPVSDSVKDALSAAPNAVLIDFSSPAGCMAAAETAVELKGKMVIGVTGFDEAQKKKLAELAKRIPMFWSSNMSVGLNALLGLLPDLTRALGENYDIEVMEIHHKRKKDAPSGTALMLGDALAEARGWNLNDCRNSSRNGMTGERTAREIGVQALRGGDVVGIHSVYFLGPGEIIQITHQAESRENFAQGALRAAAWLESQKPGKLYSMRDMLSKEK